MFIEVGSLCYQWPVVRPFSQIIYYVMSLRQIRVEYMVIVCHNTVR